MTVAIDYTFVCQRCSATLALTVDDDFFKVLDVTEGLQGADDPLMYKQAPAWRLLNGWVYVRNEWEMMHAQFSRHLDEKRVRCRECWLRSQSGMRPVGANRTCIALATQLRRVHGPARYFPA